jgi:hypothetical protein
MGQVTRYGIGFVYATLHQLAESRRPSFPKNPGRTSVTSQLITKRRYSSTVPGMVRYPVDALLRGFFAARAGRAGLSAGPALRRLCLSASMRLITGAPGFCAGTGAIVMSFPVLTLSSFGVYKMKAA